MVQDVRMTYASAVVANNDFGHFLKQKNLKENLAAAPSSKIRIQGRRPKFKFLPYAQFICTRYISIFILHHLLAFTAGFFGDIDVLFFTLALEPIKGCKYGECESRISESVVGFVFNLATKDFAVNGLDFDVCGRDLVSATGLAGVGGARLTFADGGATLFVAAVVLGRVTGSGVSEFAEVAGLNAGLPLDWGFDAVTGRAADFDFAGGSVDFDLAAVMGRAAAASCLGTTVVSRDDVVVGVVAR
jgi:hypothetical protein